MMTRITCTCLAICLLAALPLSQAAAQANENDRYGEVRFNSLPKKGAISKSVWVGSWWGYRSDGVAYRWDDVNYRCDTACSEADAKRWASDKTGELDEKKLSPMEKYDRLMGRSDKIEYDKIDAYLNKHYTTLSEGGINSKIKERQTLIRKLNQWIEDNPGEDWKETENGKRYLEITEEIDKAKDENKPEFDSDTATEFEILEHGTGQFGVESWFGHCNAWAAAAIMDDEPRHETVVDGITFSAADVKGLLTEAWMELRSSFQGSRCNWAGDSESREKVAWTDVTPAGFHIFFADQIGNKDRSFVIDRHTGSEVWNQPVKAFRVIEAKPLYETNDDGEAVPVDTDVKITRYGYRGTGSVESLGNQGVYPVSFKTTMHWVTDGLPHDKLTAPYDDSIDDETFSNSWEIGNLFEHQVEIRTLNYILWLTHPMDDPEARIVGDGDWNHGDTHSYDQLHPDFMWQPHANTPSSNPRRYENPFLDYNVVTEQLLPGSTTPTEPVVPVVPTPGEGTTVAATDTPTDIPDNDDDGIRSVVTIENDLQITEMTVSVAITHTWRADLGVTLVGPDGRSFVVKKPGTGGSQDDYERTADVRDWIGQSAKGDWTLVVTDTQNADIGALTLFELAIK
jgi:hypothetical protein